MTQVLPAPILAYVDAKNRHDIDGMLAPFAEAATVYDEGKTHVGRAAIRAWMEETTRKYRVTVAVGKIAESEGGVLVTLEIAGDFPGSPIPLDFRFTLADGRITGLGIGG